MIIDGHAHACGNYFDEKRILTELKKEKIDMVVLCPGEANSKRNYIYPMLCSLTKNYDICYKVNKFIQFAIKTSKMAEHTGDENKRIYELAKLHPDKIIQAYWVNPLIKDCIKKLEEDYKKYKFKNWLLKIARNKCIDYIRKYKRVYEANIEDITYIYDKNPGPEEAMEIREAKLIIRDFIGKLGDIDRQIITLKYSSGTTFVDIGEVMGMTEGAVKRRYYKIRDSFKKYYEREQREKEV